MNKTWSQASTNWFIHKHTHMPKQEDILESVRMRKAGKYVCKMEKYAKSRSKCVCVPTTCVINVVSGKYSIRKLSTHLR